ncbi:MAG TPA: alanine racemase [Solirubrobacteraceae bacterium]|nr:alanine racemase [Solirubrobacteraceae bacterium]
MTNTAPGTGEGYRAAVAGLRQTRLDSAYKGVPLGAALPLAEIGTRGWNVARGDLALPVLTLDASALEANIDTMQRYCDAHGVRLAPHGKTTMSPQLFAAQLDAGAWGITAATPTQVALMRRHGIPRIVLANELVERSALHWVAAELARDPGFEFLCLVDDVEAVRAMDAVLAEVSPARPLTVLIEIGDSGGRAGVRSPDVACAVARAVRSAAHLRLGGVEAFEGVLAASADDEAFARVDGLLASVRESVRRIAALDLFDRDELIVTAGGSMYFDRVIDALGRWPEFDRPVSLVLRSGCYVSHDAGAYEQNSPLAGRRAPGQRFRLANALTLWATVLSRPEPDTLIVGAGLRDAPVDRDLPRPRSRFRGAAPAGEFADTAETYRVMDQHMFIRVRPEADVLPGDVVSFDLSHPCTAFDKFPFIPLVDERFDVVDGVLTFF